VIGIVVSRADEASTHVAEHLRDLAAWTETTDGSRPDADGGGAVYRHGAFELREFDDRHLALDGAAAAFSTTPDLLAFASRHSGETGPLLTAHFTGNFGPAEYGGDDDALATAAPGAQAALVASFAEYAPEGYEVGMECTHHGPSEVGCPSLFVELGSGEAEWRDPDGARAVAEGILDLAALVDDGGAEADEAAGVMGERTVVGFGGGHYVPRFERVVRETPWTVGHVAADWGLDAMGDPGEHRGVLDRAFEASGAEHALVEGRRPDLTAVVEDLGYRVVSETWLREVADRDLAVVAAVERSLGSVEDGVRFGDRRPDDADWVTSELPDELVEAARAVDADRTRAVVEAETLAFQTRNGGSQVQGRAALPDADAYDALVDALVDVLADDYDAVRRDGDRVVAMKEAFDPRRARQEGVPEGPKFGRLAGGETVTVDGERVHPEDVQTRREDAFDVSPPRR